MNIRLTCGLLCLLATVVSCSLVVPCYKIQSIGTTTPLPASNRVGEAKLFTYGTTDPSSNCKDVIIQIDAGRGTLVRSKERGINAQDIDALLVTHLHYDHTVGVADIVQTRAMNAGFAPTRRLRVVCSEDTVQMLNDSVTALKADTAARQVGILGPFFKPGIDFTTLNLPTANFAAPSRIWPANGVSSVDTDPLTIDAMWVPHGGASFKSNAFRINSPVGSVSFAGDLGMQAPGVNAQKFYLLASGSDVVIMNPFLSNNSAPFCLGNRLVNNVPQTCYPASFPTIHSDSIYVGAFATGVGVQTLVLTHMNPAPDTNSVAPFLSDYERIATADDYEVSVRSGGFRNSLIVADDYTTITRVNIRVASLWLFDTTHQIDLLQLIDGSSLNITKYPNIGLTVRAKFGVGGDLVESTEFSVNNVHVETDVVTPWCLSNHHHDEDDKHDIYDSDDKGKDGSKDKGDDLELDCRNWSDLHSKVGTTITIKAVGSFIDDFGALWYGHPLHCSLSIIA
jgi:ribonuclease Z